jgi:outer membrane lipoprotein SlyB
MRSVSLALTAIAASSLVAGCAGGGGFGSDPRYSSYRAYDHDRFDPAYGGYDAARYRAADERRYRERRLAARDRIYRGQDGNYYCRHNDGTTGLLVGAAAGGVLGNLIAPGGSGLLGTLLGAGAGAAAGRAIDRNNVRCR